MLSKAEILLKFQKQGKTNEENDYATENTCKTSQLQFLKLLFSSPCFSAELAFQQHLQEHCTSASQGSKMIHEVPGPQLSDVLFTVQSILHSFFLLKSKGC